MKVSLLDRSRIREGESDGAALAATVERARRAERLGFHRFWVAEHHGVPGIAGGAPTVLLAALGAQTQSIRLGSGGVMLPNHSPLVVAEQALILESLYPGRIDLGLGSSLGFTAPVRTALRKTSLAAGEYVELLDELRDHLTGAAAITARPAVADPPPLFQLAMGDGLAVAAERGLPAVVGGSLLSNPERLEAYVRDFRPGEAASQPYLIASVDVAVAESSQQARRLLLPEAWAMATSKEVGEFLPLKPVEEVEGLLRRTRSRKKLDAVESAVGAAVAGTQDQVHESLAALAERTGAAEIMAWTSTYDRRQLAESDEALARLAGG